jgi:hypothetical protein
VTLITAQSPRYLNVNKQPNESTNEFGVQGSSFDERMNELVALLIAILWSIALMATCICADLGIFRPSFGDSPNTRLVSFGVAGCWLLGSAPVALCAGAWGLVSRRRRHWMRAWHNYHLRCHKCDYDLTANVSGACPECGTPIDSLLAKRTLVIRATIYESKCLLGALLMVLIAYYTVPVSANLKFRVTLKVSLLFVAFSIGYTLSVKVLRFLKET